MQFNSWSAGPVWTTIHKTRNRGIVFYKMLLLQMCKLCQFTSYWYMISEICESYVFNTLHTKSSKCSNPGHWIHGCMQDTPEFNSDSLCVFVSKDMQLWDKWQHYSVCRQEWECAYLSLYVSTVIKWQHAQGVPHLCPMTAGIDSSSPRPWIH